MDAGKLRHRIEFRRQTDVPDEYGNTKGGFQPLFKVWGNVREATGKERIAAGSPETLRTATIRVYKTARTATLNGGDQAFARGVEWNMSDPTNVGDDDMFLDILCTTGGAQ